MFRRDEAWVAYDAAHAACPGCGSASIEETTLGVYFFAGEPIKDTSNTARCYGCGWQGVVHDLVPRAFAPDGTNRSDS